MSKLMRRTRRHSMGAQRGYGNVPGHSAVSSGYMGGHYGARHNPRHGMGAAMTTSAPAAAAPGNGGGRNCAGPVFYNLPGNAGIPGCGTGTVAGSECALQILPFRSALIPAGTAGVNLNISALRAGAFKPRAWYVFGIGATAATSDQNVRFEITELTVQGIPQFVSTSSTTPVGAGAGNTCLSDSFLKPDDPLPVSFMVFGSDQGQTLDLTVNNLGNIDAYFYVTLWGDAAEVAAVGTY